MLDLYLESFFEEFIVAIAAIAGTTIFAYFRSIKNKQIENAKTLDRLTLRTWRVEKALTVLANLTALQTRQIHPDINTSGLEDTVKELMKDKL